MQIAQTNVQLYNQLRERGMPLDELALVNRAYELLIELYPGYFQADGKPFVAHGVGVASILAWLGQPAETVAVGLLHNVYGNGDFGDARRPGATPARRRIVTAAVGERVERMLARFQDVRITPGNVAEVRRTLPERDGTDRTLLLVDLADYFEKYVDMGVLYYGDGRWVLDASARSGADFVGLAGDLGQPQLGERLAAAIAEAEAQDLAPVELRPSDGRRFLTLVVPHSCQPRLRLRARMWMRRAHRALRPRARLRRLLTALRVRPRSAG